MLRVAVGTQRCWHKIPATESSLFEHIEFAIREQEANLLRREVCLDGLVAAF